MYGLYTQTLHSFNQAIVHLTSQKADIKFIDNATHSKWVGKRGKYREIKGKNCEKNQY